MCVRLRVHVLVPVYPSKCGPGVFMLILTLVLVEPGPGDEWTGVRVCIWVLVFWDLGVFACVVCGGVD